MISLSAMWTDRQAIEIFHLMFVAHLGRRVSKDLFVIKGGCNLRFYLRSIRYSEDIDFDIRTMAKSTLEGNVATILASSALALELRAKQITLEHVTSAKQTETTQRWKVHLAVDGGAPIPTKIEFSRRGQLEAAHRLEAVDAGLIRDYALRPVLAQHYEAEAALQQKIVALSRRTETQARDIFDLKLLFDGGANGQGLPDQVKAEVAPAIERSMTIGWDEFSGQVRAYLLPEYFDLYDRAGWEALQAAVVAKLEELT
jgi:predicted nucleotidyltransferase component of viral defense system